MATPFRTAPAPSDDAIRSIRVASTILDRFRDLLAKRSMSMDELELKIGESQQIYPEIWRHLGDARNVLAARGVDVAAFDDLRRGELVELGVTDVEVTREVDYTALLALRYRERAVKTATFNVAGYQRARQACQVLMATMPEVDWAALARAEDREIAAAGSLQTSKWLGIAKLVGLAAIVAAVSFGIYRLATSGPEAAAPAPRPARAPDPLAGVSRHLGDVEQDLVDERAGRIANLRDAYADTCDRAHLPELLALLRADGRPDTAHQLETTACVPRLPPCTTAHDALDRLADQLALVRDAALELHCEPVDTEHAGVLGTGLVVVIAGHGRDGKARTFRGVTSRDGRRDLVAFAASPLPTFVGAGDLDGDSIDELVMAGGTKLAVAKIRLGAFVDIPGPSLPARCSANVSVEGDFRDAQHGARKELVISVDDPAPPRGCPTTGRHAYTLKDGALVAARP
jgi:hypothetical protein